VQTRSTLTETAQPGAGNQPFLLVLGPDLFSTYLLPAHGELVVGRSADAQVFIDDPLLSHRHARFSVGDGYVVEDLGSRNGTFLRQERLAERTPVQLEPGEAVAMGSCLLVLQAAPLAPRARRAVSYGFFRLRLDEELARARYDATRRFCVARVLAGSGASLDLTQQLAEQVLRPFDTVSLFAPDEYAVLFSATLPDEARSLVSQWCLALNARGIEARSGFARYPEDGRTAAELEAHCLRVLRPQSASLELHEGSAPRSASMRALHQRAERIAHSQLSVLITGESGTGKDVLARFIHTRSARASRPFQVINCAALPEDLLEAQLFGHERGAFTGAVRAQKGLIEAAEGGSVFLDEIAEVPLSVQAKLLRLLENREIQPLGAAHAQKVDVRFIAATNVDLVRAVASKNFRADLLYRLKGIELCVPPLRERADDVLPLANHLLARFASVEELERAPRLSPAAEARLNSHHWPGNVRELANTLHRALVLSDRLTIQDEDLHLEASAPPEPDDPTSELGEDPELQLVKPSKRVVNPSRRQVKEALVACAGNQTRTADLLGIPRKRLRYLMACYELPLPRG
jgi:DNA-binding NtrC family response regulator